MSRFSKMLLGFASAAALLLAQTPSANAACAGTGCGCSAIAVPTWTPPPATTAVIPPYTPPPAPPWFVPTPDPTMSPEIYIRECAANITSCIPASVVLRSDPPPAGVPSWDAFNSLTPPAPYRPSNLCYGYGTGPCNATLTPPTNPNAPEGVTNYNYNTAFPCEMTLDGRPVAGSDVGAVRQFRMRKNESISFAFTVPPVGALPPGTDGNGLPLYRSISFGDWNNDFTTPVTKFVTISRTSGDFDAIKASANDPCYQSGVMGDMKYAIVDNASDALANMHLPPGTCPLQAGETYYINIRFQDPKNTLLTQVTDIVGDTPTTFVQDTCEWALCNSDQNISNPGTMWQDTYANAYKKEWQCLHDMALYWADLNFQAWCASIAAGEGGYTPVNPDECVGNRTAPDVYTGGTPITDCGVTIDMGCGLSAP